MSDAWQGLVGTIDPNNCEAGRMVLSNTIDLICFCR
mgnify:CR=1 FL=1